MTVSDASERRTSKPTPAAPTAHATICARRILSPSSNAPRKSTNRGWIDPTNAANPPGNERLTWLKRAVWLAADRPGRVGFVPAGDAHWWHVSTFSRAVVTDMGEAGFRLRQRDRAKAKELARRGARALARLRSEGPAVAARFRAEHGRLTSRENWARLYEDA